MKCNTMILDNWLTTHAVILWSGPGNPTLRFPKYSSNSVSKSYLSHIFLLKIAATPFEWLKIKVLTKNMTKLWYSDYCGYFPVDPPFASVGYEDPSNWNKSL